MDDPGTEDCPHFDLPAQLHVEIFELVSCHGGIWNMCLSFGKLGAAPGQDFPGTPEETQGQDVSTRVIVRQA